MCGVCGYLQSELTEAGVANEQASKVLKEMMTLIGHRGPNDAGQYCSQGLSLGFRRLTIIDLSDLGNQPLFSEDHRYSLVFNGEIYNYKSLRAELEEKGYHFRSHTDSEVLVHGYACYGPNLLPKLRGMFAFAIYDELKRELFLARDPFGIKPLYYSCHTEDNSLVFASEIKSFLAYPPFIKELNKAALLPYLNFQYSAWESTFFEGVYKLLPGHYILLKASDLAKGKDKAPLPSTSYFDLSFDYTDKRSETDLIESLQAELKASVDLHLQSDVEVGAFLSGGVDSSYITALSQPKHTFSVGFAGYGNGGFNEVDYAKKLSKQFGIIHHHKDLTAEDCFAILPKLQYHMDEPHGNFSAVPLYHLAKLAKEYVRVVLSGEGADELFAGYAPYRNSSYTSIYKQCLPLSLRRFNAKLAKLVPNAHLQKALIRAGQVPKEYFIGEMNICSDKEAKSLLQHEYQVGVSALTGLQDYYAEIDNLPELDQKQLVDLKYWLPGDILLKADKMSSAHSLELRVPFLDVKIWQLARQISPEQRIKCLETKHILRKASSKYLPNEWAKREKLGFMVPLKDWLREDKWANLLREMFTTEDAKEFFQTDVLLAYLAKHQTGKANYQHQLYLAYVFLLWYQEFFHKR
ncbi:asparagine synthase (glutamine-hydrolyzing) [Amygdalobacter nucleatus]|uniref:asparagine synthase (glutamine-hydrolyzing) n=1 Tax=Amygdalobacter nucleatus TaxID=3029274 RepID=A0A133Y7N4_9FIRM|nr:asparagine synthase (glutamine-hydrolyzing) [Amygdalobacter nucleatus]KXB39229.1 asparagine synthase [Amygdalobacter nucleatus]MDF0485445.1 asparagine synthase (glutamine-hydrolyzing) [Amygdalobacter nucleatus]